MKRVYIFLLPVLIAACSTIDTDSQSVPEEESSSFSPLTRSSTQETNHHLGIDQVPGIVSSVIDKKIESIETLSQDGLDLVHLATFDDGWALVAADDRLSQQVLAYNETGSFNPDSISSPEFAFWFEMTMKQLRDLVANKDLVTEDNSKIQKGESPRSYGLIWCRVPIGQNTISDTLSTVDHLMSTTWGQEYPWNVNCPYDNITEQVCPTGCVAVAMAQILYYLHFSIGTPSGLYHQLTPTFGYHYNTYYNYYYWAIDNMVRSNYTAPSPRWSSMPLDKYGSNTQYVADLMLDIGERVQMEYSPYGSGAVPSSIPFIAYGIDASNSGYDYASVKACLDNGVPVMITAGDLSSGNHTWVIDGYYDRNQVIDYSYEWRLALYGSQDWLDADLHISQNAMPSYDPNMFDGKLEIIRGTKTTQYLLMNWGWDDSANSVALNDGHYSIICDWYASSYHFTNNPWVIYNFAESNIL